jgi:hypothetical protein
MMHPESRHKPIEFPGTIQELSHTLGMRLGEVAGGLIRAGHLERVTGSTWRLVIHRALSMNFPFVLVPLFHLPRRLPVCRYGT